MRERKALLWLSVACIVAAMVSVAHAGEATLRVGTFRRTEVLVAFYRSAAWNAVLAEKRSERDKAKAAGDDKKAKLLETWGQLAQERAHRQLTGQAPLSDNGLLAELQKAFPDVAAEAKVLLIVEQPLYKADAIELVDVTELLVKRLPPPES